MTKDLEWVGGWVSGWVSSSFLIWLCRRRQWRRGGEDEEEEEEEEEKRRTSMGAPVASILSRSPSVAIRIFLQWLLGLKASGAFSAWVGGWVD